MDRVLRHLIHLNANDTPKLLRLQPEPKARPAEPIQMPVSSSAQPAAMENSAPVPKPKGEQRRFWFNRHG